MSEATINEVRVPEIGPNVKSLIVRVGVETLHAVGLRPTSGMLLRSEVYLERSQEVLFRIVPSNEETSAKAVEILRKVIEAYGDVCAAHIDGDPLLLAEAEEQEELAFERAREFLASIGGGAQ